MHNDPNTSTTVFRSPEPAIVQTVRGIPELHGIPGVGTFKAGEANVTALFEPPKEIREGAVETFERSINNHGRQIRMGLFAMPLVLLVQVQVRAGLLVVRDQFLKAGIVHLARGNQGLHQGVFLGLAWSQPVLKCSHDSRIAQHDYIVHKQELKPEYASPLGLKPRSLRWAKALFCHTSADEHWFWYLSNR